MQGRGAALLKQADNSEVDEPIHCAPVAEKRTHELLRSLVLAVAFVAVVLLISIALYYIQGSSIDLHHSLSLAPQGTSLA